MSIFTKLRDFVGLNEPMDYDYDYDDMDTQEYQELYRQDNLPQAPIAEPVEDESRSRRTRLREPEVASRTPRPNLGHDPAPSPSMNSMNMGQSMSNVIGMPGASNGISEVVVMEPRSFEEMPQVIQSLRERKSVVLNLNVMDPDQAQRAVDFVAGGTYAIDGHQERIGESIFLFTPSCVQVSTQSGVIHEVPQPAPARPRVAAPTPAWGSDSRVGQG